MSESLKIRLAARCEAAGRSENEDNFQVAEDLSVNNTGFTTDKVFSLGAKGTLLLVCDGMGGMNAGEVASAVGVETIKNLFAPQLLTSDIFTNDDSVCSYMKRAIVKADSRIKEEASKDEAKQGMGSTAVMAWLLGHKVYVAWCGDSRCYRYNPARGLEQLSHDHSYVQDLVDTGQLSADLAFDHPNKNIITRSLGDSRGTARPDAKVYDLRVGDVILLCSDGLSDSLRDSEIEQSISHSIVSMAACRDALWNDSRQAGWHDNVTVVLAQVVDEMAAQAKSHVQPQQSQPQPQQPQPQPQPQSQIPTNNNPKPAHPIPNPEPEPRKEAAKSKWKIIVTIIFAVILLLGGGYVIYQLSAKSTVEKEQLAEYERMRKSFSEDMFTSSHLDVSAAKTRIIETKEQYKTFCRLENELNVKEPQREIVKEIINKAIDRQAMTIEADSDIPGNVEKAEEIRKLKMK